MVTSTRSRKSYLEFNHTEDAYELSDTVLLWVYHHGRVETLGTEKECSTHYEVFEANPDWGEDYSPPAWGRVGPEVISIVADGKLKERQLPILIRHLRRLWPGRDLHLTDGEDSRWIF